jgi:Arc/MetJ-type ribon-helix-helix transcriptional regulator
MTSDETQTISPKRERRVVVLRTGDESGCCGAGNILSASGEPLQEAIEAALSGREHGVSVRVSDEMLSKLDVLVESGICESRSAAATFLMREGAAANADLFNAVENTTRQIAELKERLQARLAELGKQPDAKSE